MQHPGNPGLEPLPCTRLGIRIKRLGAVRPLEVARLKGHLPGVLPIDLHRVYRTELVCQHLVLDQHTLLAVQPCGPWIEVVAAQEHGIADPR